LLLEIIFNIYIFIIFRIEENPVWRDVGSKEFDSQFLHHEIPAVVNIATLVKRAHTLKEEKEPLTRRLEQLRDDQRNNKYTPGELFRLIQDLRRDHQDEIVSLRSRISELEAVEEARKLEEAAKKEEREKMVSLDFGSLSFPRATTVV